MSTGTLHSEKKKTLVPKLRFSGFKDDWEIKKLGEIAKIITGSTPSTSIEEYYNGTKLFVSPADIQENRYVFKTKTTLTEKGFSKGRKIKKGSVLFVCIGSTIGKVAQATEECLTNQQINSLESNKDYSNDFIYELLEKNGEKIKLLAGVQAVPQINKTDFSNFKYFVPPLPEQQKIASFLSAVDEKIQQLSRKAALLESYKKGVMQQLFSGKLRFKDENGKEYPDWEEKRLDSMISKFVVPMRDKPKELNGEIPWCRIEDFDGKYLSKSKSGQGVSIETVKEMNLKVYPIGTLLVSCSANLGFCAITKTELITNQTFIGLVPDSKKVDVVYLLYVMRMLSHKLNTLSSGTTISYLSRQQFEQFKVPYPKLKEQQKIADFLSSIDDKIESTNQQLVQTQTFKKGLLQQMFV